MTPMRAYTIVSFALLLILAGCRSENKRDTLLQIVDPDDSGIDFVNKLYEDDRINIINMEYVYNGGGVAIGDFNNDGLSDIFFTANMIDNRLYLNKGNMEFEDVSEDANIAGRRKWKSGVALVDINEDGWLDIYVCATIAEDSVLRENMLFVNQGLNADGQPTFSEEAKKYGIADNSYSSNAGFFDYDNDGDLDLYILTNQRQVAIPNTWRKKVNDGTSTNTDKLYRNNGNGTFTNVSHASGILCEGYGLGLAFLDVNKDGFTDIYVSNDYITNDLLYVNNGRGGFENRIDDYIAHQAKFSMGNDAADINNDGNVEIITLDMMPETNFRKKTVLSGSGYINYINDARYGYAHQHVRNMLQLNNGNGTFSEIGQLAGVYQTEWSWSPLFADFDNDGYRDLFVTNGFPRDITDRDFISFREKVNGLVSVAELLKVVPSVKVPNYAFKNSGNLVFDDVTKAWGLDQPCFSAGAAFADLDNDGDLDYVVNNIDTVAFLYRNTLNDKDEAHPDKTVNAFLRVKLVGPSGNKPGLGTKVTLRYGNGKMQYHDHAVNRGYISTVEDIVHFGLGDASVVDSLMVEWPGGRRQLLANVKANQVIVVKFADAADAPGSAAAVTVKGVVEDVTSAAGVMFRHEEDDKIDFNVQRTLPHKFSQGGPAVAAGDMNGDGLDDFCVGGAANKAPAVFLQRANGTFNLAPPLKSKPEEDAGLLLFDADNDGDLDLYAVSGSYEYESGSARHQDRLYKNDGRGNFRLDAKALPPAKASGSCVRAADVDADGDLDLFVGGRVDPGKYPFADESYLLRNDNGIFTNATAALCPDLVKPGMITDALWSDFDLDGKTDLIVTGEFMPVTFFRNTGEKLEKVTATGIEHHTGWFNSIAGGDFDRDGDTDYIVGNLGVNNYYHVSAAQPLRVCAKDFDNNGSIDAVLSCYVKAEDGSMQAFPVHFWDELNSQSPKFRRQFDHYREFARVTMDKFFTAEEMQGALVLEANDLHTSYIENVGQGKFKISALPLPAQVAPVNGIVVDDVDGDGALDALLVGNDFGNEPTAGQYDAFTGLLLRGNGQGGFAAMSSLHSGFLVRGDAKGLARVATRQGALYVATQNRDSVRVFRSVRPATGWEFGPAPADTHAVFTFADGKNQRVEFYYGAGYLSQSTRKVLIPQGVKEITVFNAKGQSRKISPPKT